MLTASDGIEAISLCAQYKHKIDAALVDMMMPAMDGATTIRTLERIHPQIKAIAISGFVANGQLKEARNIKNFIAKPYTTKELLQTLHNVLRQTAETGL